MDCSDLEHPFTSLDLNFLWLVNSLIRLGFTIRVARVCLLPLGVIGGLMIAWRHEALGGVISLVAVIFYLLNYAKAGRFPRGWAFFGFQSQQFCFFWIGFRLRRKNTQRPNQSLIADGSSRRRKSCHARTSSYYWRAYTRGLDSVAAALRRRRLSSGPLGCTNIHLHFINMNRGSTVNTSLPKIAFIVFTLHVSMVYAQLPKGKNSLHLRNQTIVFDSVEIKSVTMEKQMLVFVYIVDNQIRLQ